VYNKLEGSKVFVVHFEIHSRCAPGGTEERHETFRPGDSECKSTSLPRTWPIYRVRVCECVCVCVCACPRGYPVLRICITTFTCLKMSCINVILPWWFV
jgi:hypothetical protein